MKTNIRIIISAIILSAFISLPLQATAGERMDKSTTGDSGGMTKMDKTMASRNDAENTVVKATQVFKTATEIPSTVIKNAAGIAIFPGMIRAALIAGGSHGNGVMLAKQDDGQWSPPLFVSLSGGSLGAQVGVESSDVILVFQNRAALDKVATGKEFTLGVDASVSAGDAGANTSASTETAQILTYKRSSGLFAGASLTGSVLKIEQEPTMAYYNLTQSTEKSARGYYGGELGLYNRIIGSSAGTKAESGMASGKQHARAVKKIPDSARDLQQAIGDYASKSNQ